MRYGRDAQTVAAPRRGEPEAAQRCGATLRRKHEAAPSDGASRAAGYLEARLFEMNADERSLAKLPHLFLGRERLAREVEQTRARRVLALVDARRAHHDAHPAREGVGRAAGRRVGLK